MRQITIQLKLPAAGTSACGKFGLTKGGAEVPASARTARILGTERIGSGIVIDGTGLILTIGSLILEADGAIVGAPQTVRDSVNDAMAASGCDYLVGRFAFGDLTYEDTARSLDMFVTEVMPGLN